MEPKEEVNAQILDPFELNFSDLQLLSSSTTSSSPEELARLDSISRTIMETLGPSGPGLLCITGVPKASELRRSLLPLARKLALLNNNDRRRILKEHNLGSDVPLKNPDRSVSSFAMKLQYNDMGSDLTSGGTVYKGEDKLDKCLDVDRFNEVNDNGFKNLGNIFKELGLCMMELGFQLARVCDRYIGGQELEKAILESCTAKGRLIHYHSVLDNLILKEAGKIKGSIKKLANYRKVRESEPSNMDGEAPVKDPKPETCKDEVKSLSTSLTNLWQQWHYDYGIFTVLTAPMFTSACDQSITYINFDPGSGIACEQEHPPPDGHSYLQIFDPNKNVILLVRTPVDSFVVQVGESADILSKRNLRSTLHSVSRPLHLENLSRETFVVFLQPAWDKTFSVNQNMLLSGQCSRLFSKDDLSSPDSISHQNEGQLPKISQKINEVVPPLSSRLKDGMTFAEFSRETTKQYYGSSGMQSKR